MRKETFEAEKDYLLAVTIAENLLRKGLLTKREYMEIDSKLKAEYKPIFSAL